MGIVGTIKLALQKTRDSLNTDVRDLFKSQGRLVDEVFLEDLLAILIKTHIGAEAAQATAQDVANRFRTRVIQLDQLLPALETKLKELMAQEGRSPGAKQ